jgi:hypothetical protein
LPIYNEFGFARVFFTVAVIQILEHFVAAPRMVVGALAVIS